MTDRAQVVVTGVGMTTPVGHDAVSAAAALRAGIARFRAIPQFVTGGGSPATGSLAAGLTDGLAGDDRLLALAIPAAREAWFAAEGFCDPLDSARLGLLLASSPPERPSSGSLADPAVRVLIEAVGVDARKLRIERFRDGHAGGLNALARACEQLRRGELAGCVIGGVDSLVERPTLAWLDRAKRLKSDDRPAGFIPGEAAAFAVLELAESARARGARPLARILGTGLAREPASVQSAEPLRGRGLADGIRAARAACAPPPILAGVLCDLNGEYYRMKEWSLCSMRAFEADPAVPPLRHPADAIGDVGAAAGTLLLGLASTWFALGAAEDAWLLFTGSDSGARACAVVAPAEAG